jgi:hypothetical protein
MWNKKPEKDKRSGRRWKGPECNNDIRDRGLRQQPRGSKRIKNRGRRWQLHLKIKRISDGFDRQTFELEFAKRAAGMSSRLWQMSMEGSAPMRQKKNLRKKERF